MYSSIKYQSSIVQPQLLLHQPDNILWSTNAKDNYPFMEGYPGGLDGKESTCSVGDLGLILELGRFPGGEHGKPLQYSCLENPHGQRSLVGYRPWGHKESDRTERLRTDPFMVYSFYNLIMFIYSRFNCVVFKRVPEKHPFLLYWLCQSLWLCGS